MTDTPDKPPTRTEWEKFRAQPLGVQIAVWAIAAIVGLAVVSGILQAERADNGTAERSATDERPRPESAPARTPDPESAPPVADEPSGDEIDAKIAEIEAEAAEQRERRRKAAAEKRRLEERRAAHKEKAQGLAGQAQRYLDNMEEEASWLPVREGVIKDAYVGGFVPTLKVSVANSATIDDVKWVCARSNAWIIETEFDIAERLEVSTVSGERLAKCQPFQEPEWG